MTRLELLRILVGQAHANGFEFRRWYTSRLALPWISADAALELLQTQRRYYALLFSHEFASSFWAPGAQITFQVPAQAFERRMADGTVQTVKRKPYMRRRSRPDSWRFHLREMSLAEEPLRYMRRYLNVEDDLANEEGASPAITLPPQHKPAIPRSLELARSAAERRLRTAAAASVRKRPQ